LSSIDTAHNTVLSVVVSGGLLGLFLVSLILVAVCISISETRGALRWAMGTALLVWAVTSLAAAVEESRTTWLLFALIALAGRLAIEDPAGLRSCFPDRGGEREAASASETPPGAMGVAG
jgi:O-antigen ligase